MGPRIHRLEPPFAADAALHSILPELLATVAALYDARQAVLLLRAEASGAPYVAASVGLPPERLAALARLLTSDPALVGAVREGRGVLVEDTDAATVMAAHRDAARELGYRALVLTPLVARDGEVEGAVAAFFPQPH
ncbi:MAG: GAF domain-containing protein, partial [Gemmatimonadetes bacterium]|nr:GAF domain-containing protein [Gemmatimonadota bacterium]